jgi:hemerythrin superfamily protein
VRTGRAVRRGQGHTGRAALGGAKAGRGGVRAREPPPSSFLSLLETHEWLDEYFLLHQEALLAQDLPLALEFLGEVEEGQREHIRLKEEILLPVYARAGRIPGGNPEFYINEHRKMLSILDGFKETLPRLIDAGPQETRCEIIELFDRGYWFKRLLEHHDKREENTLYPALDRVTSEEERKELLKECFPEQASRENLDPSGAWE